MSNHIAPLGSLERIDHFSAPRRLNWGERCDSEYWVRGLWYIYTALPAIRQRKWCGCYWSVQPYSKQRMLQKTRVALEKLHMD